MSAAQGNLFVCVYADEGTKGVDKVIESLSCLLDITDDSTFPNVIVQTISSEEVISSSWTENADLFVMPGGRDLPYFKKLKGLGNKIIREYVANGGRYLGLCAGGYYAARKVEFMKGTAFEVCGERELCFFPGTAKGSVFQGFDYTNKGARKAKLRLQVSVGDLPQRETINVHWNGGCEFICDEGLEHENNFEILASYTHFPDDSVHAAIVKCTFRKGVAILSGVHPEMTSSMLPHGSLTPTAVQEMKLCEAKRDKLWKGLLRNLLKGAT